MSNASSVDDCLLKFCKPVVSTEDTFGKEFFEASVSGAVRGHLHFTILPLVPKLIRCGRHLFHHRKDTVFPASTSSNSASYRAAGISHYGWTVCRRCGRVARLRIHSSLWRSEDLVGFLNMPDPVKAFDEIMTHFMPGGKTK